MKKYLTIMLICLISCGLIQTTWSQKKELTEKRTLFSKTYLNEDDTYSTVISAGPIHYRNQKGEFEDIQREITPSGSEDYDYEITNGFYHVYFKTDNKSEYPVVFETKDGANLKMKLTAMAYLDSLSKKFHIIQEINIAPPKIEQNQITYPNAFEAIDVKYIYGDTKLKEEILLTQKARESLPDPGKYNIKKEHAYLIFITQLDLNGSPAVYANNQNIKKNYFEGYEAIEFKNLKGDVKFFLPSDWAFLKAERDTVDEKSMLKIRRFLFHESGEHLLLSGVKLSQLEEKKAGTVVFDPVVEVIQPGVSDGCDAFIAGDIGSFSYKNDYNFGGKDFIWVWNYGTHSYKPIRRTLIKFPLDNIPSGAAVIAANCSLYCYDVYEYGTGYPATINLHKIVNDWEEGNLVGFEGAVSWNERKETIDWTQAGGDYASAITAVVTKDENDENEWYDWDVTVLVSDWVSGSASNYGMLLKLEDEQSTTVYQNFKFRSSEYTTVGYRPKLTVTYTTDVVTTYYIRDSAGNVIATYVK